MNLKHSVPEVGPLNTRPFERNQHVHAISVFLKIIGKILALLGIFALLEIRQGKPEGYQGILV